MYTVKMIKVAGNKPSTVGCLEVKIGDEVNIGDPLISVETSKGKRTIKATSAGKVEEILVDVGEIIKADQELINIKTEESVAENKGEVLKTKAKPSVKTSFDVLVIGAGPGGYVAAIYAAMNGKSVGIVEKNKLGGTCLNVGCIPTKTLVESAHLYEKLHDLEEFGLNSKESGFDYNKIIDRKEKIINNLNSGIAYLMQKHNITVIKGCASFKDNKTVIVDGEKICELSFKDLIIASGSKQAEINIKGIDSKLVIDNTGALNMRELPKSISIIGGGVIGMEFAFIFNAFGVDVHVLEYAPNILLSVDEEASSLLSDIAKEKGIKISVNSKVESIIECDNNMAVVNYLKDGKTHCVSTEKVLIAIGRSPNTKALKLEKAGIKSERGAILVNEQMNTNVEHIYAIGDATNIMQLAHVASHQGIIAVDNILNKNHKMKYNAVPSVVYTFPEIANVGVSKADSEKHVSSRFDFEANGKAMVMNQTRGFVKLIKDKESGIIVGATIIGPDASTNINALSLAIKEGMDEEKLTSTIFPHPTTGESIHEAAMGLGLGMIHQ